MLNKALNKVGGIFGLGGGQGDYYVNPALESEAKKKLDEAVKMGDNEQVQKLVKQIGGGKLSLSQILEGASATGNQDAALSSIASSPVAGSSLASQQVIEDPLLAGLYGADSSMSRAVDQEKDLAARGFSLQPEDYEAYGQGSGNIARTFGKQEQSLANALASRGLAAGNSGAAQQSFSGLMGNKFEQLGQLQRQIADDRVRSNMERLNQTRNYLTQTAQLGQQAQGQKFDQNQVQTGQLQDQYGLDINKYQAEQGAAMASQKSKEDNRQLGLADAVSGGIFKGVESGLSNAIAKGASGSGPQPEEGGTAGGSTSSMKRKGVIG
jgi:hypothetical protein